MGDLTEKVNKAKTDLLTALGENSSMYLTNLRLWFRQKCSKEDFYNESCKLCTPEQLHLHNRFFIAILNKIDAIQAPKNFAGCSIRDLSYPYNSDKKSYGNYDHERRNPQSRKRRRSSSRPEHVTFEPYDIMDFIAEDNLQCVIPPEGTDSNLQMMPTQRYAVQELFLPDTGFILGRFLIGAWECGLTNVEDNIGEYMALAVQSLLKNLISALVMKRKHYKVTGDGSYYYDIGAPLRDPSLRNTVTRQKIDDAPLDQDKEITSPNFIRRSNEDGTFLSACEEVNPTKHYLITLSDAQRAFTDRNLIASHAVYSINMERLTQMMH